MFLQDFMAKNRFFDIFTSFSLEHGPFFFKTVAKWGKCKKIIFFAEMTYTHVGTKYTKRPWGFENFLKFWCTLLGPHWDGTPQILWDKYMMKHFNQCRLFIIPLRIQFSTAWITIGFMLAKWFWAMALHFSTEPMKLFNPVQLGICNKKMKLLQH